MDETAKAAQGRRRRIGGFLASCAVLALLGEPARAQPAPAPAEAAAPEAVTIFAPVPAAAAPAEGAEAVQPAALQSGSILLDTIYVGGAGDTWEPVAGIVAHRTGTGSKTNAAVIDIPASVSVITADEMRTRGVEDLDGALNYTAGVSTNLYGGDERYDFVAIRGFNQTTSGIYRDGLPVRNYNLTGGRVEPYGMERVEVLKGSTSTLYGANNPGGLVNMITKRPVSYNLAEAYATVGPDHVEFGGDVGGPIDSEGVWTYRLTGKWQDSTLPNEVSSDDRLYLAPALTWKPGDSTALTLMADYNERRGSNRYGIPRGSGLDPWTFLGEPDFETNDTTEWGVGFALEHDFDNGLVFRSHGRHMELDLLSENVYAAGNLHPDVGRLSWFVDSELSRDSVDGHFQYDAQFGSLKSRTLIGADYTGSEVAEDVRQGTAPGVGDIFNPTYCGRACVTLRPYYRINAKEDTWGVYAQEELSLSDRLILTFGARYDEIKGEGVTTYILGPFEFGIPNSVAEDAVTLRGGLTFKATEDLSLYGTYSESFSPVLPSTANALSLDKLEPMMGEMYELGVKWRPFGLNGLVSLAAYDLKQTHVPRRSAIAEAPGYKIEQDGEVRSRGVELEGKVELTDRTNLVAAYSYVDAEVTKSASGFYDGTRPMFIPEHTASLWVDHTIPGEGARGDLTLGLGARYVGSRFANEDNSFKLKPYAVFDASARYKLTESASLELKVDNLFDQDYVSHVETWSEPDTEFYGDPLTVRLTLRHTW